MKQGLKPIIDEKTEILILGSCPGDNSILNQKYYNSPINQFWKLIGDVINIDLKNKEYSEKIKILLENKIGLWDVMHSCEREGSLDSSIVDYKPNDFSELNLPNLKKILFNGKKAFELKDNVNIGVEKRLLSSSSGANSISYKIKLSLWEKEFDKNSNFPVEEKGDKKMHEDYEFFGTLKLHEAIVLVLEKHNKRMSTKEISDEINKYKLYSKKDGSSVQPSQIFLRCKNYNRLFSHVDNNYIEL